VVTHRKERQTVCCTSVTLYEPITFYLYLYFVSNDIVYPRRAFTKRNSKMFLISKQTNTSY